MTPIVTTPDCNSTHPLAATLIAKLTEFDVATIGLAKPEPGSKIVKTGDLYSLQAPGYTQSLYRWWSRESQDTTKQYIQEMSEMIVSLIDEADTMLGRFSRRERQHRAMRTVHRGISSTDGGLHDIVPHDTLASDVAEVAEVLISIDTLVSRMLCVSAHVRELYVPVSDSETVPDTETESIPCVYDLWNERVSAAHAALCVASSLFRG